MKPPDKNPKTETVALEKKNLTREMIRLQQNKAEALRRFGDGQPYNRERVIAQARAGGELFVMAAVQTGRAIILLQSHEEHGDFLAALDEIGIQVSTAYRYIHAALVVGENKDLARLPLRKLDVLYQLPEAKRQALTEKGSVGGFHADDVEKMSLEELQKKVRKLSDKLKKGEEEVDILKGKLRREREGAGDVGSEFARWVSMARMGLAFIKTLDLSDVERDVLEREVIALKALFADLDMRVHPELYPVNPAAETGKREGSARARKNIKPVTPANADEDTETPDQE